MFNVDVCKNPIQIFISFLEISIFFFFCICADNTLFFPANFYCRQLERYFARASKSGFTVLILPYVWACENLIFGCCEEPVRRPHGWRRWEINYPPHNTWNSHVVLGCTLRAYECSFFLDMFLIQGRASPPYPLPPLLNVRTLENDQ